VYAPAAQEREQEEDVEIEAFLADSVQTTMEGKLYVQGAGWNVITTAKLPVRHDRIGIGIIIRVPYTATNQPHKLEVYLLDDGKELPLGDGPSDGEGSNAKIYRLGGEFNVGRPPTLQPGDEQLVSLAINIDALVFDRADSYEFVLELDGSPEKRLPFRVHQVLQPGVVRR
jgi:Family of unknown function (DUF6941)